VEDRHRDLAASLQRTLEDAALHMARHLHERTGLDTLLLSGSLVQNWVLNGRIARDGPFKRVVVSPFCGDDGTAVGAALSVHTELTGTRPQATGGSALGPGLDAGATERILEECGLSSETPEDIIAATAGLLTRGAIVGWARGAAEFGPRALGHRSILAAVGREETVQRLRTAVKRREAHHPFGVSMTGREASRSLESGGGPSMLVPATVTEAARAGFGSLVLEDGTLRVQVVDENVNEDFHSLLEACAGDGPAALINTSLNLPGRPPAVDARAILECFFTTGMDALVLGDRLLTKAGAESA
jgi:carbamoyltransferase